MLSNVKKVLPYHGKFYTKEKMNSEFKNLAMKQALTFFLGGGGGWAEGGGLLAM